MAKIKNTNIPNYYGDGNQQEVTMENGEKYIIRNTNIPNYFGGGYQKEIVKAPDYSGAEVTIIFMLLAGLCALVAFISLLSGNVKWIVISLIGAILFLYLGFFLPFKNAKEAFKMTALIVGIFAGLFGAIALVFALFISWVTSL